MLKKAALVLVTTGVLAGLSSAPALADASDIGGAVLTTAQDVAAAALDNTGAALQDPNTTCKVTATGSNAVQRVNALVAEVHAEDVVTAVGTCISLSSGTYSGTVTVYDQYYTATSATTGTWSNACSMSSTATSVSGVLQPVPPVKLCTFAFPSSALNKYHRAKGVLTNSRGQTFVEYSPVWFVGP